MHDLVIAGGGPAGMMAGLLFARAGVNTLVLEKHADFLRDFRGDTVHPSTMELMDELRLLDAFLQRPHDEVQTLTARVANRRITIADTRHLPVKCPFIALMPQWDFLDFLADEARKYPTFALRMEAEATDLLFDGDRVAGVRLASGEEVRARLTIAADGRRSVLRDKAGLPKRDLGAPIDVLWFRLPKGRSSQNMTGGTFGKGTLVVQLDRGDYWQCAYVVAKGGAEALKARGIEAFRRGVGEAAPELADVVGTLTDWDQVKLLSVSLDRLEQWSRPGLLAIGDAAHAMSPVGGVGINLAIQDAVAAANILAAPMARGEPVDALLPKVQERRIMPVRVTQAAQKAVHERLLKPLIESKAMVDEVPFVLRLFDWFPLLRRIPARLVGLGIRREHVRSPDAFKPE
ncbi:putative oxidoreductase [Sphingomonas changbaiensis NBRC 104936]|uniref:Putative oxidoreductase n=1 Tax=Sphingomonas changbaiensis NBRC 104936 TaxID=1219043 RepID=A0A0E9MLT9_9SPHN|nr:putative oxidoreductase [Sphingomonas changbaiensis NBRC 104936]